MNSVNLAWRPLGWKAPSDGRETIIGTRDQKFSIFFLQKEDNVPDARIFKALGKPSEKFLNSSRKDYEDIHRGGYEPRRDIVVIAKEVEVHFLRSQAFLAFGENSYFRFGGKLSERELEIKGLKDLKEFHLFAQDVKDRGTRSSRGKIEYVPGTTIALHGWENWDHFIRQTLSSLVACLSYDESLKPSEINIIGSNLKEKLIVLLEHLGFKRDRIIHFGKKAYKFERLLMSPNGHRLKRPSNLFNRTSDFILNRLEQDAPGPKRLYVSRSLAKRRRIDNEEELEVRLRAMGFTCLDPGSLDFKGQANLFRNAQWIVGPHGMGMANAIFARNLRFLVEIMPSSWMRPSYLRTAQLNAAAYGVYFVNPDENDECHVDIEEFLRFITSFEEA